MQGAAPRRTMQRHMSVLVHRGRLAGGDLELRGDGDVGRKALQSISLKDLYALQVASLRVRARGWGEWRWGWGEWR